MSNWHKETIKVISQKDDSLDVSCMIIQNQDGKYIVDIHEYL